MKKVTVIIPVYNEKNTIESVVSAVENALFANLEKEIILTDDGSTDGTREILEKLAEKYKVIFHEKNSGKGAAIRSAVKEATGDFIVIQDADLEYDPSEYDKILPLLVDEKADVVYGSRLLDGQNKNNFMFRSMMANIFLTKLTNLLYGIKITDMETCYKAFRSEFIKKITIKSNRFNFEPEITAKLAKQKIKIVEVPISYNGRRYGEGKKINWKDGLQAIRTLIKYRFVD